MQGNGGVGIGDRHPFLGDDVAVIRSLVHVVQGDTCLVFPIDQHPVDGATTAISRQQGAMEVETPLGRNIENFLTDHRPIVKRKNNLRG